MGEYLQEFENIFEEGEHHLQQFENVFCNESSEQRSSAWFAERCSKATASEFKKIMTKGKGDKPSATRKSYAVALATQRLTNKPPKSFDTPAMAWGRDMELEALKKFEEKYKVSVKSCGFIQESSGKMYGASPDGLIDDDGLVECKCKDSPQHLSIMLEGVLPDEHKDQVYGQMLVTGRKYCWFISYDPRFEDEDLRLWAIKVYRDEAYISKLREEILKFLDEVDEIVDKLKGVKK
jgi:exodeoxyribonuclease (lambda-induced)